jgi:hypothetical protein
VSAREASQSNVLIHMRGPIASHFAEFGATALITFVDDKAA